mmetsp:Transcript_8729/g.22276  ORF Transcript_8729/g.22276 Transcript_8729/m.22276 type:complete len:273 (+) Transcript_8729:446-1264(+)
MSSRRRRRPSRSFRGFETSTSSSPASTARSSSTSSFRRTTTTRVFVPTTTSSTQVPAAAATTTSSSRPPIPSRTLSANPGPTPACHPRPRDRQIDDRFDSASSTTTDTTTSCASSSSVMSSSGTRSHFVYREDPVPTSFLTQTKTSAGSSLGRGVGLDPGSLGEAELLEEAFGVGLEVGDLGRRLLGPHRIFLVERGLEVAQFLLKGVAALDQLLVDVVGRGGVFFAVAAAAVLVVELRHDLEDVEAAHELLLELGLGLVVELLEPFRLADD